MVIDLTRQDETVLLASEQCIALDYGLRGQRRRIQQPVGDIAHALLFVVQGFPVDRLVQAEPELDDAAHRKQWGQARYDEGQWCQQVQCSAKVAGPS
ncbi:hypothetical protein D3C80_1769450 [compost metagenome]